MSGALFGNIGGGGRGGSKNLVEFRAGKMYLKGTTVSADKRKGLVYIHQSDDSLIHFCWKDRTSGVVEDDLIIFPDDCEFKRVPQCTTGRAYILKFKSSSRKFFFWMQEPKTDKDEEHCKKVNDSLNNPPAPGSGSGLGGAGGLPPELASLSAGLGEGGLQSMLGNIDQNQLMQLLNSGGLPALTSMGAGLPGLGSSRPASSQSTAASTPQARTTAPPTATTTTATQATVASTPPATTTISTPGAPVRPSLEPIQLSDLQSILRNMNIPSASPAQQERVDLSQMLSSDVMAPILANPEVQQRLLQFAPEGENLPRDPEQLRETLQSPQFQQAMGMFTAAFQSGQLGPLMGQFGLGEAATQAASQGDLEAFGQALQGGGTDSKSETKKDGEKEDKGKKADGDDDDNMQVD